MVRIQVRYNECDMSGYAYNGSFFPWMNLSISWFFKKAGVDTEVFVNKKRSLMMVHQSFDYKAPVTWGDEIDVQPVLKNVGETSIHMQCNVYKGDKLIAVGNSISVFMDLENQKKISLPPELRELSKLVGKIGI